MSQYIAIENATGDIYQVCANSPDEVCKFLARDILKLDTWNDPDFDLSNVDFDIYCIDTELAYSKVEKKELKF